MAAVRELRNTVQAPSPVAAHTAAHTTARDPPSEEHAIESDLCRQCAACCKNVPFVELSVDEVGVLEDATGLHPDAFTDMKRTDPEERFLHFEENGDCVFLDAAAGAHACRVYAARPAVCRDYPGTLRQSEACEAHSARCGA
jgi:Fe-S-cluster containining protein